MHEVVYDREYDNRVLNDGTVILRESVIKIPVVADKIWYITEFIRSDNHERECIRDN